MKQPIPEISGYKFMETIQEGENSRVFRIQKNSDSCYFIAKIPNSNLPIPHHTSQYESAFAILNSLKSDYIISAKELVQLDDGNPVLIVEDIKGTSVDKILIEKKYLPTDQALQIGIKVCRALVEVHEHRIVYSSLSPANIILNTKNNVLKLIDFKQSVRLLETEQYVKASPDIDSKNLYYIAPEQTGRMVHGVDFRADLYSLGAVLYELLMGKPPFNVADQLSLVHCHLAYSPSPPHESNSQVPKVLSRLILKLLAKDPKDRYQIAQAVLYDLECILQALQAGEQIDHFQLASQDQRGRFRTTRPYQKTHLLEIRDYDLLKSKILFLYRKYADALKGAKEARKILMLFPDTELEIENKTYHNLILASLYWSKAPEEKEEYLQFIIANQNRLQQLISESENDHHYKIPLIAAEIEWVKRQLSSIPTTL